MSRIGKKPVLLPSGVTATVKDREVKVKGPKGELSLRVVDGIDVTVDKGGVTLTPKEMTDDLRAKWGLQRTLVNNLVEGVSKGFAQQLEIAGVGFRAAVQGKNLQLQLGYSHDVIYPIPAGIDIKCEKPTLILVSGSDKQQVGQVAAEIRGFTSLSLIRARVSSTPRKRSGVKKARRSKRQPWHSTGKNCSSGVSAAHVSSCARFRAYARGCLCSARRSTSTRR